MADKKIPEEFELGKGDLELAPEDEENGTLVDPLEALLAIDPTKEVTGFKYIARLKAKVEFKAPGDEYEKLVDRCTRTMFVKRTHQKVKETDYKKVNNLLLFNYIIKPNLSDPKLLAHYGVNSNVAEEIVAKVFLPGERDAIADAILTLAGYTDEVVDDVKNS